MPQSFEATITVVDNGYVLEFAPTGKNFNPLHTRSVVFSTSYLLGQWIDNHLPKPPGEHNALASAPSDPAKDY